MDWIIHNIFILQIIQFIIIIIYYLRAYVHRDAHIPICILLICFQNKYSNIFIRQKFSNLQLTKKHSVKLRYNCTMYTHRNRLIHISVIFKVQSYSRIRRSPSLITYMSSISALSLLNILVGEKSNFSAPIRSNSSRDFGRKTSFLPCSPFSGQLRVTLAGNSSLLVWLVLDEDVESFLSKRESKTKIQCAEIKSSI